MVEYLILGYYEKIGETIRLNTNVEGYNANRLYRVIVTGNKNDVLSEIIEKKYSSRNGHDITLFLKNYNEFNGNVSLTLDVLEGEIGYDSKIVHFKTFGNTKISLLQTFVGDNFYDIGEGNVPCAVGQYELIAQGDLSFLENLHSPFDYKDDNTAIFTIDLADLDFEDDSNNPIILYFDYIGLFDKIAYTCADEYASDPYRYSYNY